MYGFGFEGNTAVSLVMVIVSITPRACFLFLCRKVGKRPPTVLLSFVIRSFRPFILEARYLWFMCICDARKNT